jgi:hypothetical protein
MKKIIKIFLLLYVFLNQSFGQVQSKKNYIFMLENISDTSIRYLVIDPISFYKIVYSIPADTSSCFLGRIVDVNSDTLVLDVSMNHIITIDGKLSKKIIFEQSQKFYFPLKTDTLTQYYFKRKNGHNNLVCSNSKCDKWHHWKIKKIELPEGKISKKQMRKFIKEYKAKSKAKVYGN